MRQLFALVTAAVLLAFTPAHAQPGGATVTILHFNDVYEIAPIEAGRAGGLARVSSFRARLKAQVPNLITTLGGDYVSPSALGTARVNGERLNGEQMVAVLNVVGLTGRRSATTSSTSPRPRSTRASPNRSSGSSRRNVTDAAGAPFPGTVPTAVVAGEDTDRRSSGSASSA